MPELLFVAALIVAALVAFAGYRFVVLGRGMHAYDAARALIKKGDLTPREAARLEVLRERARSWGSDMDPGLPPLERIEGLRPDFRWIAQNVTGREDPAYLETFVETVIPFLQGHGRGFNSKQFGDDVVLRFARLVYMIEHDRAKASGTGDDERRSSGSRPLKMSRSISLER